MVQQKVLGESEREKAKHCFAFLKIRRSRKKAKQRLANHTCSRKLKFHHFECPNRGVWGNVPNSLLSFAKRYRKNDMETKLARKNASDWNHHIYDRENNLAKIHAADTRNTTERSSWEIVPNKE
jgi:hypothetical protein